MNVDDVVFISNEFDAEQSSKIARVLNAHEIKTTTDMNAATIIVKPVNKPLQQKQNNGLIVAIMTEIEKSKDEIIELYDQIYQSVPKVEFPKIELLEPRKKKHKRKKFIQNQTIAKFNKIQYKHKQILFTRTHHK